MGSISGLWMYTIALSVFAYEEGGAAAVGLVGAIRLLPGCDRGAVRGRARRSLPPREGAVRGRDPAHAADARRRARRLLVVSAARRLLPGGGREPRRDRLPPAPGSAPARAFVLARGAHRRESRLRHDRERRHLRRACPGRAAPRDDEHRDGLRGDGRDLRVRDLPRRPDPSAEARGGEGGEDERGHGGAGRVPDDRGGRQLAVDHRALRRTDARRGGAQRPARRHVAPAPRPRPVRGRLPGVRGRDRWADRSGRRARARRPPAARDGLRARTRALGPADRADRDLSRAARSRC